MGVQGRGQKHKMQKCGGCKRVQHRYTRSIIQSNAFRRTRAREQINMDSLADYEKDYNK